MTITSAKIQLNSGFRVTHRFFSPEEFIVRDEDGKLIGEDGHEIIEHEFWALRKNENWFEGWELWNP